MEENKECVNLVVPVPKEHMVLLRMHMWNMIVQ